MAEHHDAHIDNLFREEFEQIEVRYNALHWQQLQHALIQAGAAGAASSLPLTSKGKFSHLLKKFLGWWIGAGAVLIAVTLALVLLREPQTFEVPVPSALETAPSSTTVITANGDTLIVPLPAPKSTGGIQPVSALDSLSILPLARDTTDTIAADTLRPADDLFLFW